MDDSIGDRWDVAVVGAGACGITTARALVSQGRSVILLDKGSRPGGRLAGRRIGDTVVDTGASGVDTDDPIVVSELTSHANATFSTDADGVHHWSFGRPANAMATHWLGDTALRRGLVTHLERGGDGSMGIATDGGEPIVARTVVLTAPAPQSIDILARSGLAADGVLGSIAYAPAVLLVAAVDRVPDPVPEPRADGPLESVRAAGWGGTTPALVATTHPGWAAGALDGDASELTAELLTELRRLLPQVTILAHDLKVWRYAHATSTVAGDRFVHCEDEPAVIIAGDGFGPPGDRRSGIPRAVRSGLAVAAVCA